MFENKTYESIMSDMLDRVSDQFDKREGSIIWDALAPCAVELANAYIAMDSLLDETFADTADLFYLKKRAAEKGINQIMATKAILQADFTPDTVQIPIGARFSCDELNYVVLEEISAGSYEVQCETAGSEGNNHFGTLIPIDFIEGLETATLSSVLVSAIDDEGVEHLRKRFFDSLTSQSFGGNIADYKDKTKTVEGYAVGACKITPAWNGGGTVKVTILDGSYHAPSQTLIDAIQNALDPVGHGGQGYGLAPIGHVVTVTGATTRTVNITATITYAQGWSWESASQYIKDAVDEYFKELSEMWEDENALVVRISAIDSKILSCEGVIDITGTQLNGSSTNLQLLPEQIPERGTINGN